MFLNYLIRESGNQGLIIKFYYTGVQMITYHDMLIWGGKKSLFPPLNFVPMTPWLLDSLTLSSLLPELVPALSPPIPYLNARNIKFYKSCSIHYKFLYLEPLIPQFRYPLNQKSTDSGTSPAIFYIPSIPVGIIPESRSRKLPYCTWYDTWLSHFAALFFWLALLVKCPAILDLQACFTLF